MSQPSERDVLSLLAGLDVGPLPELDIDAIMRGGHRYRRRQAVHRGLASLVVVVVAAAVVLTVARLSGSPAAQPVTGPNPTTSASSSTAPSPSAGSGVRVVSSTPVVLPGGAAGLVVVGQTLWALEPSSAGQPGQLLRATTADPRLGVVASVGTYASGLAATPTRVWVAAPGSDPRDHAVLSDTVQEFDNAGHLLRSYHVLGASAVAASGDTAWVLAYQSSGTARVYELSAGAMRPLATLGTANPPPPGVNPMQLTGDGGLAVAVTNVAGAGIPVRLWLLDAATGATRSRVDLPFPGWASVAVQGSRVLVAGSAEAGQGGGVVAVQGEKVTTLDGCPTDRALAVAASTQQAWLLDTETGGTWLLGATGCAPGRLTQPATPLGGAATLAVPDQDAWVLAGGSLMRLTVGNGLTSPRPPAATLPPASTAPASLGPVCTAAELAAKQTKNGAMASQPFSVVTVTNTSGQACTLRGYPTLVQVTTSTGTTESVRAGSLAVTYGGLYEVPDPGPTQFTLPPGGSAWFALGTGTAYDGPIRTITQALFSPAGNVGLVTVGVTLDGNAPSGKPLGVGVTAFAPGTGPA